MKVGYEVEFIDGFCNNHRWWVNRILHNKLVQIVNNKGALGNCRIKELRIVNKNDTRG